MSKFNLIHTIFINTIKTFNMKKTLTFLVLFVFSFSFGQPRIQFFYDATGNQTKRVICGNCPAKNATYKNQETLTDSDLLEENKILYYPNPVLEELYVKWKNTEESQVTSVELYSMSGQQLNKITNLKDNELTKIGFTEYPTGYYIVVLVYSNGDKKDLKIVKQ